MTTKERITAMNKEWNRIEALLNEKGMYLCQAWIFKGEYPYSKCMGKMENYAEILEEEEAKKQNKQLTLF